MLGTGMTTVTSSATTAMPSSVRAEDENGEDDLDAYSPAPLALGDFAQQPRPILGRAGQPAALPGDLLEDPAQPLRDGLVGVSS